MTELHGERRILLVVDVQNGFTNSTTGQIPSRIRTLIELVHFEYRIFTQFINPPGSPYERLLEWCRMRVSPEVDIVQELAQFPTHVLQKHVYTCVNQELISILTRARADKIFIVGIDTDICVMKSAVDLFECGFTPMVLVDCCMSHAGASFHEAALKILPRLIGRKQVIMDSASFFATDQ